MIDYSPLPYNKTDTTYSTKQRQCLRRDILYAALITSILSTLVGFSIGRNTRSPKERFAPPVTATSPLVFILNETFTEAPSPDTDAAWASLIPMGRGFVTVDAQEEPLQYDKQRQLEMSSTRAVSTFHQLHCLDELRIGYYAKNTPEPGGDSSESQHHHHHSPAHMKHCFDYLRQAIMCAADMTLEPLRPSLDGKMPGVNGWGVQHTCRTWDEVRRWTEARRATEEGGIQ